VSQEKHAEGEEDDDGSSDGQGSSYFSGEVLEHPNSTPHSHV
jgi:hypothetical protein